MTSYIEAYNVFKSYGKTEANIEVTLEVNRGEIFAIAGPNGSGKTTFLKMLVGLLKPDKGKIKIDQLQQPNDAELIRTKVGYMPQNPFGLWHLNVREAIYYTACLRGMKRNEAKKSTKEIIEWLSLEKYERTLLNRLSGGIMQTVNLGIAIVGTPDILVLDEPTASLDPLRKIMFWNIVNTLNKQKGTTIILVTHSLSDTEKFTSRMALFYKGRIVYLGTPADLKSELQPMTIIQCSILDDTSSSCELIQRFEELGKIVVSEEKNIKWTFPRELLPDAIMLIENNVGLERCENLRINADSLEDLFSQYFSQGGEVNGTSTDTTNN